MKNYSSPNKQKNIHILIVDNEKGMNLAMYSYLSSLEYTVSFCDNGFEATKLYSKLWREIDVVAIDINMPGIDGIETLSLMIKTNPDIKAFFVSGQLFDEEIVDVLNIELNGYLEKPFTLEEFLEKIEQVIGN